MSSKSKLPQQRYESVRYQLQKQTAALLAQRRTLDGTSEGRPQGRSQVKPFLGDSPAVRGEQGDQRTQEVIVKLQEIIRMCKEQSLTREEMQQVVKVERQVLNYLQRAHPESDQKGVRPTHDTPQAQRGTLPAKFTWGKPNNQNVATRGDDTLDIIAQLERKALSEIIHLQRERDALKIERDQLVEQIRGHRSPLERDQLVEQIRGQRSPLEGERLKEENRLLREENQALQLRIQTLSAPTVHRPSAGQDFSQVGAGQHSHSQIAAYQNQLKRATVVINQLRSRLGNVAGLQELHEQGERIRRETSELLHYKSRNMSGDDAGVIVELQQRLQEQERGKAVFFQELRLFKQKFAKLQEENLELKRRINTSQHYQEFSPLERPSGRGRQRGGFSEYENTLNQMRQVR